MPPTAPPVMLTTGPVAAYPEALAAMARPVLYDADRDFRDYYTVVLGKARDALRTSTPPLILQAEAILGVEAAAASLIARGDAVLNLVSGVYGKGFETWAKRYGGDVVELAVPYDEAIRPEAVAQALRARPDIRVVSVVHHDTPSGTLNPLPEIGRVVAEHGALLIVDAVSSFGGMDVHPDPVHADAFIASPSKCLGSTPGLTLLALSERAWEKIAANPHAPRASFLSLSDSRAAGEPGGAFPVTPSISLIYALEAVLDRYLTEGPERVWARHALSAGAARAGLQALGLQLWPKHEGLAAPTATVFRVPVGFSDLAIRDRMRDDHGVLISLGHKETAGKVLRIGHMGPAAQPIFSVAAVAALSASLAALGWEADIGAGAQAARRVIEKGATGSAGASDKNQGVGP